MTRGIGRCRHSSNFSNRQTPANTNSLNSGSGSNQGHHHNHSRGTVCSCNNSSSSKVRPRPMFISHLVHMIRYPFPFQSMLSTHTRSIFVSQWPFNRIKHMFQVRHPEWYVYV